MSTTHTGNIQPQLDLEEHDGVNNAKRVSVAAGSATIGGVRVINTDGTDNSYTSGGVYGQKVHVVGISDLYAEGTIAAGSSLTGHKPVAIGFKDGSGNNQFAEGTTANGIEVDVTRIGAGTATIGSVKLTDGTDTATVATALDSRNGLDTQASSIASKNIVDFVSTSGALSAGGEKIFSPGGTRATYYDLDGYEGLYFSFTDNSPGASGGTMYFRWSRDGSNTAYNDPGDGSGLTNFDGVSTATLVGATFIPKKNRYVNFVFVQGSSNQGSSYPQLALMDITAYPYGFFTSAVSITNEAVAVSGPSNIATYANLPVIMGGVDSIASPTAALPILVSATGQAAVQGTATAYNGTPLVTVQKLVTTSTQSSVTAGTTSGTLVASSTSRVGVIAYNNGQYPVYYRLSATACTTASGGYSGIIWPGCSVQIGTTYKPYSGACTCITPSGTGNSTISLSTI